VAISAADKERPDASTMRLGMVFFLISETFLFGSLFTTYYYLRAEAPVWPPVGVRLDTTLAIINTVLLLSSSGAIWWAGRSIRKDRAGGLASGLAVMLVLAATFLGITAFEWTHLSFRPWTSAYGSIFYTLTGFHALHVFAGILLMLSLLVRTLRHEFSSVNNTTVEVGSLYWHFVDFIWIIVFTTLFIIR
jgi:cytochrome c oxidase subunit 3